MIYNIAQVAELLGCTEEIVAERIHQGDLPGARFGRSWVIPVDALRERLKEKALEEAQERRHGQNKPPRRKPIPPLPTPASRRDPRP